MTRASSTACFEMEWMTEWVLSLPPVVRDAFASAAVGDGRKNDAALGAAAAAAALMVATYLVPLLLLPAYVATRKRRQKDLAALADGDMPGVEQ